MIEPNIRLAKNQDLQAIVSLLLQLSPSSDAVSYHRLELILEKIVNDENYYILVCEVDNKIIGTSSVFIRKNLSHNGRSVAYLENMVVDKKFRSKGVGGSIMESMISISKSNHCYKIILDCSIKNVEFYEKLGFRLTNEANMRMDIV